MTLREEVENLSKKENDVDRLFKTVKPFVTSWASECGIKLTPEALEKFKQQVFKTIIYYNTMSILRGNK